MGGNSFWIRDDILKGLKPKDSFVKLGDLEALFQCRLEGHWMHYRPLGHCRKWQKAELLLQGNENLFYDGSPGPVEEE
jgi:hypothetical protein